MRNEEDKAYRTAVAMNNELHGQRSPEADIANNNALENTALKDDLSTCGG